MEVPDIISQLKVFVTEAETYHQAGNVTGAVHTLSNMKDFLNEHIPIVQSTPPATPKSPVPTQEELDQQDRLDS